MLGYGVSASMMLASAMFLAVLGGWEYYLFDEWPLVLGAAVYIAGAAWWFALVVRATRRLWLHLILAWAPAIGPLYPVVLLSAKFERDDTVALALLAHLGPGSIAFLACMAAALVVLLRITGVGAPDNG